MRINVQSLSTGLLKSAIAVFCAACLTAGSASGQTVLSYRPMVSVGSPAVGVAPVVATRRVSAYRYGFPAQPTFPTAVMGSIASPVVGSFVAVPVAPVVTYRPVVPTVAYRPATAVAPVVTATVSAAQVPVVARPTYVAPVYAAPVVVRPKVYIPGQPVRNTLRAITP